MSEQDELVARDAEIQQRLKRIAALRTEEGELKAYLAEATGDLQARITVLKKERERIESELALHESSMRESESEAFDQLDQVAADIKKLEEQVKSICHAFPAHLLKVPRKFAGHGYAVSVSRASTHREVKSAEMIEAHPEYAELEVEGDKLVVRSVDLGVLDRLLAMGTILQEDVDPYITTVKDKSPSVTISTLDAAKA